MQKLLFALIALVVIAGGVFLLNNQTKSNQTTGQPTPTVTTQSGQSSPSSTVAPSQAMAESSTVTLTSSGFNPQTLTVKAGTKVTWVNKSGQTATVNSDPHPTHILWPFLNLGRFADGESLSVVFDKPGTYTYHNHLDASETGTVVVE